MDISPILLNICLAHGGASGSAVFQICRFALLAKELAPEIRVNAIALGTISMAGNPPQWEQDYIRRFALEANRLVNLEFTTAKSWFWMGD